MERKFREVEPLPGRRDDAILIDLMVPCVVAVADHAMEEIWMATKKTSDALEIIHRRYFVGQPEREAELDRERRYEALARMLRVLRLRWGRTSN